tara:strand:- start:1384 stop:1554 length:171 start_codon:yes stop_codon:yes gene_type:complete
MNKVLLERLVSENKQIIPNEAFNEIGICINAIKIRRFTIKDGLQSDLLSLLEVNFV